MTDTPSIPDPSLEALQALAELPFIMLADMAPEDRPPAVESLLRQLSPITAIW